MLINQSSPVPDPSDSLQQPEGDAAKRERRRKKRQLAWFKHVAVSTGWWILSIGFFVSLWEVAAAFKWINPLILPPPHQFLAEISNQKQFLAPKVGVESVGGNFIALSAIADTLKRILAGLSISFIAGLVIGCLAYYFKPFGKLVTPIITLLAPIAPVAWIPLAILAFGVGDAASIFVVFIGLFFTLVLGTISCIQNVDQTYINTARVLGATRFQVMRFIILPAIIPNLFVILRMNFFGAWMAVLAAEMVGVSTGLGAIVMVGRQMFNTKLMFLGMAMIGLVGYLMDTLLAQVQKRVLWWKDTSNL